MKMLGKTAGVIVLSVLMGNAWAECPRHLNADEMYDCIVNSSPSDDGPRLLPLKSDDKKASLIRQQQPEKKASQEDSKHAGM